MKRTRLLLTILLPVCLIAALVSGIALAAGGSPTAVQGDAKALADTLVSEGIPYEDAAILSAGKGFQYATFTGLPTEYYGFEDGIILSSGNAVDAFTSCPSAGANTTHSSYSTSSGSVTDQGYAQLYQAYKSYCAAAKVSPAGINDAAVFAIQVIPTTNVLSFQYFFASNEYDQSPKYNDTFALWVVEDFTEQGGGKWHNIAKLSNGNAVNIRNTIPSGGYKTAEGPYYRYTGNKTIGYLGRTIPLSAEIETLTPGEPVWVVMAIGDAGDSTHDSAVFVKAKSIRFAKASAAMISYDANGGAFDTGAVKGVNVDRDTTYTVAEGVPAPTRSGYLFDGWYTDPQAGTAGGGTTATANADATWYAHWTPITSTVTVPVMKDGAAMPGGTTVELRQNGATAYTLAKNDTNWSSNQVVNGTYQVFVNGEDAERTVTVDATAMGQSFSASAVNFYTVTANVTLDGSPWSDRTVSLSDGTALTGSGSYTAVLREKNEGNTYHVYVDGENKGSVTVGADVNARTAAPAYHTIQVTIADSAPWTNAAVTLRAGGSGADSYTLAYQRTSGTSAVYSVILPGTDENTYNVFVDGRNVAATVSTTSKTAAVTFLTASVKITGGYANMPVSISNGTDSYTLTGGNTSGGAYTCTHVFDRDDADYAITVGGTIGTPSTKVVNASAVSLTYYTVAFKTAGGGAHATQYVLSGAQARSVSIPIKNGYAFLGWGTSSSSANFTFTSAITSAKTLYPVYEAAGITLGQHIQTGKSGNSITYTLPNLTIKGYSTVSSVVLKLANCSDVSISGVTATKSLDTGGNGTVILTFASGTTGAAAQAKLRAMTVTVKNVTAANHTIQATVYGSQY